MKEYEIIVNPLAQRCENYLLRGIVERSVTTTADKIHETPWKLLEIIFEPSFPQYNVGWDVN